MSPLSLKFERVCERPKAPDNFSLATASVSAGGEGLFLYVENDRAGDVHAREERGASFPKPRMPEAKAFKLFVCKDEGTRSIDIPPLDISFPHVELFPDGRVLVAGARCAWRGPDDFDRNGAIFDPRTGEVRRVLLGDGIADVAVDEAGRIWASYFDEGVFGNFGWGIPGPSGPGAGGLVCFDATGQQLWRFNRDDSKALIDDCYAMHATRRLISVFFYSDFKVCEVGMDFAQTFYEPTDLAGSHAIAASSKAFLLSSQYDEPTDTMHLVLRKGDQLTARRQVTALVPDGMPTRGAKLVGRAECMHVLNESGWFRASLEELVAAAI